MFKGKNSKVEMLKSVSLFSDCSKKELEEVASLTDNIAFDEGKVLIEEGSPLGMECLVLVDGEVEVSRGGSPLATLGPGAILGEMSLLEVTPRSATVKATKAGSVLAFDVRSFKTLMNDVPRVADKILAVAKERHK